MLLVIVVVLPTVWVVIMNLMELLFERDQGWRPRTMKVAWDTCVLALGLTGGLFSDTAISGTLTRQGPYHEPGFLLLSMTISVLMAVLIALLRRGESPSGRRALFSLLLGGCTLVIPTYLVYLR